MRMLAVALLAAVSAPALAGPAPRTFKASLTQGAPLPAVPSGRVSATDLAPPPGIAVSTRGPLLKVPDPVLVPPQQRKAARPVPLPPPNPYRLEGCPVSFD